MKCGFAPPPPSIRDPAAQLLELPLFGQRCFPILIAVLNISIKMTSCCCAVPELFEGDIVMTKSLETDIDNMEYAAKNKISKFDAIANRAWVNGVIPYTFSSYFSK